MFNTLCCDAMVFNSNEIRNTDTHTDKLNMLNLLKASNYNENVFVCIGFGFSVIFFIPYITSTDSVWIVRAQKCFSSFIVVNV